MWVTTGALETAHVRRWRVLAVVNALAKPKCMQVCVCERARASVLQRAHDRASAQCMFEPSP
eukprot:6213502-Pleurochrysis_carterae.AAC.3